MDEPSKEAMEWAMAYFTADIRGKTFDFHGDNQKTLAALLDRFAKQAIEAEFKKICEFAMGRKQ